MAVILMMLGTGLFAQRAAGIINLEPQEFRKQIQAAHVQLIDVRTAEEYDAGHIEGAENIDYKSNDFLMKLDKLDREKPVYIYCRIGNRSNNAAKELFIFSTSKAATFPGKRT